MSDSERIRRLVERSANEPGTAQFGGGSAAQAADSPSTVSFGRPDVAAETLPRIPGYDVLATLGRGGMGVVYKARQASLKRLVALKMIRGLGAEQQEVERFYREAEAIARLRHPNVVTIHEVGAVDGQPYFSLEFIEGGSLASLVKGQPQPASHAARLVDTAARAIAYCHQQGIVHRDLKPANVLLQFDQAANAPATEGQETASSIRTLHSAVPKITDFGLAKELATDVQQTRTGAVVGTPSYMAPEQAEGRIHDVGALADVYALGAILYELLTGRPPFRGANAVETLDLVRNQEPLAPAKIVPSTPRDLETICLKCLQKEPRKRYASALDLADELRRFQNGEPIRARPVSAFERAVKLIRRRPLVASLLALLLVVTAASFALILRQLDETEQARQAAVANGRSFKEASDKYKRAAEDRRIALLNEKSHLYVAHMNLAQKAWERADMATLVDLLKRHLPKNGEPDNRGWEWYYYWGLVHSDLHTLRGLPGPVRAIAFAPTSWSLKEPTRMLLGIACEDGSVLLWDALARTPPRTLKKEADLVRCLTFSADGKLLAWATGMPNRPGQITLWNMESGQEHKVLSGHKHPVSALAFSRDGKTLASAAVEFRTSNVGNSLSKRMMYLGNGNLPGEIKLWSPSSGEALRPLEGDTSNVLALGFLSSRENILIAGTANHDGNLRIWNADTGKLLATTHTGNATWSLACHPTKRSFIAAGGRDMDAGEAELCSFTGKQALLHGQLLGHGQAVLASVFSPDGAFVATSGFDKITRLYDWRTRTERSSFRGHGDGVQALAFSPDGMVLASGSWDGTVKLWDLTSGQQWTELDEDQPGKVIGFRFSADGKLVHSLHMPGAKLWDLSTRFRLAHTERAVVFSPDGDLREVRFGPNGPVALVDAAGINPAPLFEVKTGPIARLQISRDLKLLATITHGEAGVKLWETATGRQRFLLPLGPGVAARGMFFAPDGRMLYVITWGNASLAWDTASGRLCGELKLDEGLINDLAFSRDGKLAAAACDDRTVRVFNPANLETIHIFRGHTSNVMAAAFAPDGRTLVSGGWDRQIKLWDLSTHEERLTLPGPSFSVHALAFSPDGKTLMAGALANVVLRRAARSSDDARPLQPLHRAAWHRARVEYAALRNDWDAVRFHVEPLLAGTAAADSQLLRWQSQSRLAAAESDSMLTSENSFEGTLSTANAQAVHEVKMQAGVLYVIDLRSKQFDALLRLENASKKVLAIDDDGGGYPNSRFRFTPPADGVYRLVATSFGNTGQGAYVLIIREYVQKQP